MAYETVLLQPCSSHLWSSQTLPKPWSMSAFITMLARVLRVAEYDVKVQVLAAIKMLQLQVSFSPCPLLGEGARDHGKHLSWSGGHP